jgi:hypothetical protein
MRDQVAAAATGGVSFRAYLVHTDDHISVPHEAVDAATYVK